MHRQVIIALFFSAASFCTHAQIDSARPEEHTIEGGAQTVPITGQRSPGSPSGPNTSVPRQFTPPVPTGNGGGAAGGGGEGQYRQRNSTADPKNNSEDPNCTSNPVIIATGEKYKSEIDFESFSSYGMSLERTYRSRNATGQLFGPNWTSSFDVYSLSPSTATVATEVGAYPANATVSIPGGGQYTYHIDLTDAPYVYRVRGNSKSGDLYYNRTTRLWSLYQDKKKYNFLAGGGIATSVDRFTGERLLTVTWVLAGFTKITRLTNLVGQQVNFTWTGNRVTQVTNSGSLEFQVGCPA